MSYFKFIIWKIKQWLYAERVEGKIMHCGLLPLEKDERDYKFGWLFGKVYAPKNRVVDLPTLSIKNQSPFNTCAWNAYAVSAEPDEKCVLSVPSLVTIAQKAGYISGTGFSNLRDNQLMGQKYGICEEVLWPDVKTNWDDYSSYRKMTPALAQNAFSHKSKNFFQVSSREEVFKALDDGHIIHTGMDWYSGYNMGGGLSAPYILTPFKGVLVGGHGFVLKGYDLDKGLFKFQNSYGENWGDNGCFYMKIDDWFNKINTIGYVRIDEEDLNIAELVKQYEGKQVKGNTGKIYLIKNGQKRLYPDSLTFFIWGGLYGKWGKTYLNISQDVLNYIPEGNPMQPQQSPLWPFVSEHYPMLVQMSEPLNLQKVKELVDEDKQVIDNYNL